MELRPYQQEAVAATLRSLAEHRSSIIIMPTATGKTNVIVELVRLAKRGRCMILAHTEELVDQAAARVADHLGGRPDIDMASRKADCHPFKREKVVVASVQSHIAGTPPRMEKFDPGDFSLVVFDECHHAPAKSWQRVADHYRQNPRLRVVGVTATPDRADRKTMRSAGFEHVAYEYTIAEAIADGWIVAPRQSIVEVEDLDFSGIRTTAGDLNGRELASVMEEEHALHGVAGPTVEIAGERRVLIFTASVRQAQLMVDILNRHRDGSAAMVSGKTPRTTRREIVQDFASGRLQFLCNVGCFTEGFDDPGVELIVMARPTKSRSLYCQMIGRGTRVLPGTVEGLGTPESRLSSIASSAKPYVEILDFSGNAGRHRLVTCMDILGEDMPTEVRDRAARMAATTDAPADVTELLKTAADDVEEDERQRQLEDARKRAKLRAKVKYSMTPVDPFNTLTVEVPLETESVPRPATDKQVEFLFKQGIDGDHYTFRQARRVITEIRRRWKAGLCSMKQVALLQRFGIDGSDMTKAEAGASIDRIASNGWRNV